MAAFACGGRVGAPREIRVGDRLLVLHEAECAWRKFVGTFRECWFFSRGFGGDQAAELRYEMARCGRAERTAKE